jgi:outer membrane protein W
MFKKMLFSVAALSVMFTTAQAQQYISLGPVVGFGHSGVTNGDVGDNVNVKSLFNPSFKAGVGLIYAKHAHWGFGGEVVYSQEGYKKTFTDKVLTDFSYDETNTVGYIRVPLRAYYFFGKYKQTVRPKVYAGPSFAFKVTDDIKHSGNNAMSQLIADETPVAEFNSFDLGIQVGAGVNITLAKAMWLNIDLNYYQGVLDAVKDPEAKANFDDIKTGSNLNQNLRLQVGVLFGLGKIADEAK